MRKFTVMVALGLFALSAAAQIKLPQPSPAASVSQDVGVSNVTITYHRPSVKGRQIWGGLVPYDKIWRLGANEATTLEISHPAKVGGKDVAAGKYALFAIPGEKEWTFILNSVPNQWGTYYRDEAKDVAKFTAAPQAAPMTESLTISLRPVSGNAIEVESAWEKVRVPFTVEFDTKKLVWKAIDDAIAAKPNDSVVLLQAARYANDSGERLSDAMKWAEASIAAKESFSNNEIKARLLQREGKTAEAIKSLDRAIALATEAKAPADYLTELNKARAEWTKK